jgi:hypothetical protein
VKWVGVKTMFGEVEWSGTANMRYVFQVTGSS